MALTRSKKIAFYAIWLALPLLFLLLVELVLRLAWTPDEKGFVNEVRYDNIDWYEVNRSYLQQYFPYNIVYFPEFKPVQFRKDKPDNLVRIFCLGGSSMYGTPYLMTANIPGILRRQLRHLYPGRQFEVINLAATAINSNVIRRFVHELEPFEADLILIYMGHNEFYGPDGVGASGLEKTLPLITDLKYAFRSTRIGTWLRGRLRSLSSSQETDDEINLMRDVSAGSRVRLDSDDARRVFDQFSDNLAAMLDFFQDRGIPVIVSEVSSNLDFPPFVYDQTLDNTNLDGLKASLSVSDFTRVKELLGMDSTNAMVQYLAGQLYWQTNNEEAAYRHLSLARDHDRLKFRAPQRINQIMANICAEQDIPLIRTENVIRRNSEFRIPGKQLFWEHLHLKEYGYYHIARLFLQQMIEGRHVAATPRKPLPAEPDSLYICWLDRAYADLAVQKLTARWPFSDYPFQPAVISTSLPEQLDIARAVHKRQLAWMEGAYRSAMIFEQQGRARPAETTYRAILEEYPANYYAHYQLARLLKDTNRLQKARFHYGVSIRSNSEFFQSQLELGLIENNMGHFADAVTHFKRALELLPATATPTLKANIYYGLSAALANQGDIDSGLNYIEEAVKADPNYTPAQILRQQLQKYQLNAQN